jgi:hypothetical protein
MVRVQLDPDDVVALTRGDRPAEARGGLREERRDATVKDAEGLVDLGADLETKLDARGARRDELHAELTVHAGSREALEVHDSLCHRADPTDRSSSPSKLAN